MDGSTLKKAREAFDETQAAVATRADVKRTRLSLAENGLVELTAEESVRVFGAMLAIATERLAAGSRILFAPCADERKACASEDVTAVMVKLEAAHDNAPAIVA
jgi:transcriptional regulator with XRE-family HTH domain